MVQLRSKKKRSQFQAKRLRTEQESDVTDEDLQSMLHSLGVQCPDILDSSINPRKKFEFLIQLYTNSTDPDTIGKTMHVMDGIIRDA